MKEYILIVFFMSLASGFSSVHAQDPITVMSFNIRYDNPSDADKGNGWVQRRENQVALIRNYDPDLIGVQEALKHQLDYLKEELEGYEYFGVGRDNGKEKGEYSAIFYKKKRFDVSEHNTFWLSETPEKPSKSWDAALPRIVTWGAFEDKLTHEEFHYFNTHFDHIGQEARKNSAHLILRKIDAIAGNGPAMLTGDFNVTPDAQPYAILSGALKDARQSADHPYGPEGTFSGFELKQDKDFPRIDYIFVQEFDVKSFETIADFFNDKFPSDHLPIIAEVVMD